jgi:hypothetical protein
VVINVDDRGKIKLSHRQALQSRGPDREVSRPVASSAPSPVAAARFVPRFLFVRIRKGASRARAFFVWRSGFRPAKRCSGARPLPCTPVRDRSSTSFLVACHENPVLCVFLGAFCSPRRVATPGFVPAPRRPAPRSPTEGQ